MISRHYEIHGLVAKLFKAPAEKQAATAEEIIEAISSYRSRVANENQKHRE